MAGLFHKDPSFKGGKFLVQRRDGSVPDWPYFVLGGRDPAAAVALRAYAVEASRLGMDPQYVQDVLEFADAMEEYRQTHGDGDPDAPRHRKDDPAIVAKMIPSRGA